MIESAEFPASFRAVNRMTSHHPNRSMKSIAIAALCCTASQLWAGTTPPATDLIPSAPAATADDWTFEFSPYLWAAFVDLETNLPWSGPGLPPSSHKPDTEITGAFMFEAKARRGAFGVFADFNWLQLDTDANRPGPLYSGADLQTDWIYTTAGFSYALPLHGDLHVELQAGARLWHIASDFTMKPGLLAGHHSSDSETTVCPLLGVDLRYDLSPKWQLLGRGTLSGDADANSQWDLYAGVGYRFNSWCDATIGYRYMRDNGDNRQLIEEISAHGVQAGLTFRF